MPIESVIVHILLALPIATRSKAETKARHKNETLTASDVFNRHLQAIDQEFDIRSNDKRKTDLSPETARASKSCSHPGSFAPDVAAKTPFMRPSYRDVVRERTPGPPSTSSHAITPASDAKYKGKMRHCGRIGRSIMMCYDTDHPTKNAWRINITANNPTRTMGQLNLARPCCVGADVARPPLRNYIDVPATQPCPSHTDATWQNSAEFD
jgi:hypothetical protein